MQCAGTETFHKESDDPQFSQILPWLPEEVHTKGFVKEISYSLHSFVFVYNLLLSLLQPLK